MCFTVAIDKVREELEKELEITLPDPPDFRSAYYFSAFDHPALPVVTSRRPREALLAQWGLIPRWVRDRREAERIRDRTVNARWETLTRRPAYRHLAGRSPCLLPVTGFYEWHQRGSKKVPFFIRHTGGKAFYLGGLCDEWTDPATGELLPTFTLVTVPASPLLARIHNTRKRMPLLLKKETSEAWLNAVRGTLPAQPPVSLHDDELAWHAVAPDLRKRAAHNPRDPALVRPLPGDPGLEEHDLFS